MTSPWEQPRKIETTVTVEASGVDWVVTMPTAVWYALARDMRRFIDLGKADPEIEALVAGLERQMTRDSEEGC